MLQQIYQPFIDVLNNMKRFSRAVRIKYNELEITCTRGTVLDLASFIKHHSLLQGKVLI
jgi:hypothetical protein